MITKHARERAKERHPDWSEQALADMARLAVTGGMMYSGYNGCKRYRYLGVEFTVEERQDVTVIVTVV